MPPGLAKAAGQKTKLNRNNFIIKSKNGETVVKAPGDINGLDFAVKDLTDCTVFLIDHLAQLTVDRCKNCKFFIGPIQASIFVRDCSKCEITVSCS